VPGRQDSVLDPLPADRDGRKEMREAGHRFPAPDRKVLLISQRRPEFTLQILRRQRRSERSNPHRRSLITKCNNATHFEVAE
jgi:hypothetical protein